MDGLQQTLGERLQDMVGLMALATRPSKQGRGYGSTLVRVITDIVRF